MSARNLRRNLNNLAQDLPQSRTESSAPSATPPISKFLGGSLCYPGNPRGQSCQFFNLSIQSPILGRHYRLSRQSWATVSAISAILPLPAFSAIPATLAVSAMSARNLRRNLNNPAQEFPQSRTESSAPSATPPISKFLGGSLCYPGHPRGQSCQFFNLSIQSPFLGRHYRLSRQSWATVSAISAILPLPAFSAIPATLAVSAMSARNLRRNLAISTILLRNFRNLGLKVRHPQQPRQSRNFWAAVSAILAIPAGNLVNFSISAFNLPFSAGIIGYPGNLGQQSRRSRQSCNYLHSRQSQQPWQSRQCRPAISVAISTILLRNFRNLGLKVRHPQQPRQSRNFWAAVSAILAIPAGNLVNFSISACNHPFSAGNIGNTGNLGRQSRRSRQSCHYLHSRQSQQSWHSLQCRPAISVAISTILVRTFGKLGLKIRHSQQPHQSRHFWAAISAVPSGKLVNFFSLSVQSHIFGRQSRESRQSRWQFRRAW